MKALVDRPLVFAGLAILAVASAGSSNPLVGFFACLLGFALGGYSARAGIAAASKEADAE